MTLRVASGEQRTVMEIERTSLNPQRIRLLVMGVSLSSIFWLLLWFMEGFWNSLYFTGVWMGATLVMYSGGLNGYPGLRRHGLLMGFSMLLWWWFELVNVRVNNWEYLGAEQYSGLAYVLMGSLAFSTVVPALDAACGLFTKKLLPSPIVIPPLAKTAYFAVVLLGISLQLMVFILPEILFPFVWIAPFLILDGIVGYEGGCSLSCDMIRGQWRRVVAVGLAGLLCGVLWEFWNFWATPKWVYHIPWFDFWHIFEMPVLGYGGYIPFAWSVYQLLHLKRIRRLLYWATPF